MFLHLATNISNIDEAITRFREETNINIEGFTKVIYDITDLASYKRDAKDLKDNLVKGCKYKKFVIVRLNSLDSIPSLDMELYEILKRNAHIIEV